MKILIKKVGMTIAALLLTLQMYGIPSYAAEGDISFTDPAAEVGEKVDVTVRVFSATTQLGDIKLNMKYNPKLLKFEQGSNAVDNNGQIDLTADLGEGTSDVTFVLTFTTLKEGTAKLTVSDYTATNIEGANVELKAWDSTITIGEGGPVDDQPEDGNSGEENVSVTVNGETYTVNGKFSEKEIPDGFEEAEGQIDGKKVKALFNKESGTYLYSLKNQNGDTKFFLSDESGESFKKTVVVDISMDKYILIIDPDDKQLLPEKYQSTTMTLNGTEFSIWNNAEDQDYYLIYALNAEGKPGYYQYDAIENTYQRYNEDLSVKKEDKATGILNKVTQYISGHLLQVLCVTFAIFFILLVIIIILAIKLAKKGTSEDYYLEDEEIEDSDEKQYRDVEEDVYEEDDETLYEEDDLSDYEMEFDDYYDEEEFYDDEVEDDSAEDKDEEDFRIDFIEL